MLVAMSTQLCSGPSPAPNDVHPFIDAAMSQVRYSYMHTSAIPNNVYTLAKSVIWYAFQILASYIIPLHMQMSLS